MKKAVIYGAGNIGRGFIGQLFYESGYSLEFIDINKELVARLNARREYPVRFAASALAGGGEIIVKNVRGLDGGDCAGVAEAIAGADIMATAVGANILARIMRPVAEGINKRLAGSNARPLNIILCENLLGADKLMRDGVREHINAEFAGLYEEHIGFVEASVGRMVPIQTEQMKAGDDLRIVTESYGDLPVDKAGFKGGVPDVKGMSAHSPFEFYIRRKLFVHNMGHAACAYIGGVYGHNYIWQAIRDGHIKLIVSGAMRHAALALSKLYGADMLELDKYIGDLVCRFANWALGDTAARVGADIKRKLSPDDRLVGAYKICVQTGVPANYICLAIAAALNFKGENAEGLVLDVSAEHLALIGKYDGLIKSGAELKCLLDVAKRDEKYFGKF